MSTVVYQAYIGISFFPEVHPKKKLIHCMNHKARAKGSKSAYIYIKFDMCRGAE